MKKTRVERERVAATSLERVGFREPWVLEEVRTRVQDPWTGSTSRGYQPKQVLEFLPSDPGR